MYGQTKVLLAALVSLRIFISLISKVLKIFSILCRMFYLDHNILVPTMRHRRKFELNLIISNFNTHFQKSLSHIIFNAMDTIYILSKLRVSLNNITNVLFTLPKVPILLASILYHI